MIGREAHDRHQANGEVVHGNRSHVYVACEGEYHDRLSGWVYTKERRMRVPRPVTREALYIYLHECTHFHLHSRSRKPKYIAEYEAERWAQKKMRRAGLAVPMTMVQISKRYVADMINQHLRKQQWGPDQKAVRFAGKEWRRPMMVDTMMTIPEVAAYLKMSKSKVYLLVQRGEMPHVKIGRNVRVRESDLSRYLEGNRRGQLH